MQQVTISNDTDAAKYTGTPNHENMTRSTLFLIATLLTVLRVSAQNPTLSPLVTGLTTPVGLTHAGDDRLFVTQQNGWIRIIKDGEILSPPFLNISSLISTGGERGLLGLAFHPDYTDNGYFYVNYTASGNGATRISRFSVSNDNPNIADASSEQIILSIPQPYSNHNGGHIEFGSDGFLYIGMGDGGSGGDPQNFSQNNMSLLGKMLRIDVNTAQGYLIPPDNPFADDDFTSDEIWAFGLRNPWKFSFDRETGDMWIGDVGQNNWEEVNFQPAASTGGENYGWRCYEGNVAYNLSGCGPQEQYTFPVHVYPNQPGTGCSVTGGVVYRGERFPALYGTYFYADFCSNLVWGLSDNGEGGWINTSFGNLGASSIAAFGEDACGEVYIVGRSPGVVYLLKDNECADAVIQAEPGTSLCDSDSIILNAGCHTQGIDFQWHLNGEIIEGATGHELSVTVPGNYAVEVLAGSCSSFSEPLDILGSEYNVQFSNEPDSIYCLEEGLWVLYQPEAIPPGGVYTLNGDTIDTPFFPGSLGAGSHVLTYSVADEEGCMGSASVTLKVQICQVNTEDIHSPGIMAQISPNPTYGAGLLKIQPPATGEMQIVVTNMTGRVLFKKVLDASTESTEWSLDKPGPAGLYYFRIFGNGGTAVLPWMVVQ